MILRLLQLENAHSPILFNAFGSVISSSPLFQKQLHPISSSLLSSLKRIYFRFLQYENVDSPIVVILFGMTTLLILLSQKLLCRIFSCLSLSMADCKKVCRNASPKKMYRTLPGKIIVLMSLAALTICDMLLSNSVAETKSYMLDHLDHPFIMYMTVFTSAVWLLFLASSSY